MKVIFKNVGQGDSVLLEWTDMSCSQIGIFDCKKFGNANPTLEHLQKTKLKEIALFVLSHPHKDHYSGALELLDYCEKNRIRIIKFIFSASEHPKYLAWHEINDDDCTLFASILSKASKLTDIGLIKDFGYPVADWTLRLNDEFSIKCIAPSGIESKQFIKQINFFKTKNNELRSSQSANLLATVFMIYSNKDFFLLTSDATIQTFQRINERNMEHFLNLNLTLCQIPHHGSKENHLLSFWQKQKFNSNCPAIVSAGLHKCYSHPHKNVIKDYYEANYKIFSTNCVNGIADYLSEFEYKLATKMDIISDEIESVDFQGDQHFEYTSSGFIYHAFNNQN